MQLISRQPLFVFVDSKVSHDPTSSFAHYCKAIDNAQVHIDFMRTICIFIKTFGKTFICTCDKTSIVCLHLCPGRTCG